MKNRERLIGFLGAVIVHLVAGIIFILVKIGSLDTKTLIREYEIIVEEADPALLNDLMARYRDEGSDGFDREILNIARNLAAKPDVSINPEDYIDRVKEEMIKSGILGPDNYIDEQKRQRNNPGDRGVDVNREQDDEGRSKQGDLNEIAARYSGPTRIYYNLPGRTHVYLPLPIYKCEGGGKVALLIEVNPKGAVVKASVIAEESTTSDPCLIEAALGSALSSRFTPDASAIKNQTGTLTYHFVPQWQ